MIYKIKEILIKIFDLFRTPIEEREYGPSRSYGKRPIDEV